tara:strand:+ start:407 stop:763 length:357 start_codon:yes stop_codon:yes gene_type:complete
MEKSSEIIIPYNSKEYNNIFFKKREKKGLLLLLNKKYLRYIPSPYEDLLTLKINCSRRISIFNKFIDSLLNIILMKYNLIDIKKTIKYYIGGNIDNVYIEDKTWGNLLENLKIIEKVN